MLMDIHQIIKKLPHRYPFLLVDRVIEFEKDVRIKALKNVTINEPFFNGHFPNRPVMPGVLMLEALAQASALLSFSSEGEQSDGSRLYYFAGIDGARFRHQVVPGDVLRLEVEIGKLRRGFGSGKGTATVDGKLAAEGELLFVVGDAPAAAP